MRRIAYGHGAAHRGGGGGTMPSDWGCATANIGFSLAAPAPEDDFLSNAAKL